MYSHNSGAENGLQLQGSVAGPAVDMDGLREAVAQASASTGEVRRAITAATFQPRAAAFTSLIQQCARAKNWEKALEVFETMKEYPAVKVGSPLIALPAKPCQDGPALVQLQSLG